MRKFLVFVVVAAMASASCGGGGSSPTPTPTPTSTGTKVVADAATTAVMEAAGEAIINGIIGGFGAIVVTKATVTQDVNYTGNCTAAGGAVSGGFTVTGTATADCDGTEADWSCINIVAPVTVVFTDCAKVVTLSGTTYNEVLNGTATTTARGSLSGSMDTPQAVDVSGTMAGIVTLTGDVAGDADLGNVTYGATGNPLDPTVACGGTAEVTVTGETAQTCTVASDCEGCSA
jgi:hypothetical protein